MSSGEHFEQLYRDNRDAVYAFAHSIVGDGATAEDVVAQSFEKLWRRRALIRFREGKARALLFTTVRNTALDELRRRKRQAVPTETLPEQGLAPSTARDLGRRELLGQALAELSDEERQLIALRFWGGLDNAEIGDVLGISTSNVGTRAARILTRLRAICDESLGEDV